MCVYEKLLCSGRWLGCRDWPGPGGAARNHFRTAGKAARDRPTNEGGASSRRPWGDYVYSRPRYEKLELRIELRATYQNPYDPDQLDLWAEFTAPSGKVWKIWGFYNPSSWSALWMVRFTPVETGTWHYVVKVKDHEGIAESAVAYHSTTWLPTGSSSHGAISFNRVRRREERLAKAASL